MKKNGYRNTLSSDEIENTIEGNLTFYKRNRLMSLLFIVLSAASLVMCIITAIVFLQGAAVK